MVTAKIDEFYVDENLKGLVPDIRSDEREELIRSIKTLGLLEPISVLPKKRDGQWIIIDGFQRFDVIKENELLKQIPFRVRHDLKDIKGVKLREWVRAHARDRRHMNKFQKASWAYDEAKALGWFEEAEKRMKAGKKDTNPLAKTARGYRSTLERIEKTRGVSRRSLSIYHRLKKIEEQVMGINPEVHLALMQLDLSLDQELIGYDLAEKVLKWWEDWVESDKPSRPIINKWEKLLDEMKDKPKKEKSNEERKHGPKLFKVVCHDLDLLPGMVEASRQRGEIESDRDYVPEFRLRLPTTADYKKGNVFKGSDIKGTWDESGEQEEEEVLDDFPLSRSYTKDEVGEMQGGLKNALTETPSKYKKAHVSVASSHKTPNRKEKTMKKVMKKNQSKDEGISVLPPPQTKRRLSVQTKRGREKREARNRRVFESPLCK